MYTKEIDLLYAKFQTNLSKKTDPVTMKQSEIYGEIYRLYTS